MRRYLNGVMLPARTHEEELAYKRERNRAHKKEIAERGRKWRKANRERFNAITHLRRLRALKDPRHSHVRKMAEICAKYPKKRIVYK